MSETPRVAVAVVGVGAILPDAPDAAGFWDNVKTGRYSISEVDPARWDPELYYDPDPQAPDKTYSKIGGWVREWEWNPIGWHLPLPPRVADQMDDVQKWALNCARAALVDYGWPTRALDVERTAVILGNAMGGEKQARTSLRVSFPEFVRELEQSRRFKSLSNDAQEAIIAEAHDSMMGHYPVITEDTMPGELANVVAGRVANMLNLNGPNFICDAACASALAAVNSGVEGLMSGHFDAVLAGGADGNLSASTYVKFCKIRALSATGTRPYAEGADGFVPGEGAALLLLKRLDDAERAGDRIYAVIRGIAGSSDGKGKGITAPNPIGPRLAIERAWHAAGLSPATATMIEGHGTSTAVGDVVEAQAMTEVFGGAGAPYGSIALGSVKSNIGHLKAAAGAAGLLKAVLAIDEKVFPPSINARVPNPGIDFAHSPLRVNHELTEWPTPGGEGVRRAGVSAFGFGGTNFHAVLEEYIPGRLNGNGSKSFAVSSPTEAPPVTAQAAPAAATPASAAKAPLRGALVVGAATRTALGERIAAAAEAARAGIAPAPTAPLESDLRSAERVAIDYADAADLAEKAGLAVRALAMEEHSDAAGMWKALRSRGIHRGRGGPAKVAFLYTGQGSQYANMLASLREIEPIVAATFVEADAIMTPLLGRPLSEYIFVDRDDKAAVDQAEQSLRETEITQPAIMAADLALTRLLDAYGVKPDMVMGHSLGEYGALMAAGVLTFEHTLEAVSARGREMSHLDVKDRGLMAAVLAPLDEIEAAVAGVDGCIIANFNSTNQAVIGGATAAVRTVMQKLSEAGRTVVPLPVSHAFHTSIVAPASEPLRAALTRLGLQPPSLPIVSNVTGELYPTGDGSVPQALDLLARQVASPVQFVTGLRTLYREGARVMIEVGPKKALQGFTDDVLGDEVVSLFTNHPKVGDVVSFNQALCGLYAAGLGTGIGASEGSDHSLQSTDDSTETPSTMATPRPTPDDDVRLQAAPGTVPEVAEPASGWSEPVVITGASLGLPRDQVFDDGNVARILDGEQFIDVIPTRIREAILDKHITRLVKRENGTPSFEVIDDAADVIKLAGRGGAVDLVEEYGVSAERVPALDRTTVLAIAAGIDALRDAGIPMVMRFRTTSLGTQLAQRYQLAEALSDDTGVIFASAFPGGDALVTMVTDYERDRARREELHQLESLRTHVEKTAGAEALTEIDHRIHSLTAAMESTPYGFDRRFLFRALSMGHSQLAEIIGARGPNTQINSACASTTQAVALAEDWIHAGRCRRVVIVAADDVTSDHMLEWVASGFLASGAAATDGVVEEAALPFDRRRHGMLIGMGAAAMVVESASAARERGIAPICEVLGAVTANSAFHGTRLDPSHITQVMETLVAGVERDWGITRDEIARSLLFMSHETYTPARGGSAAAEVESLRAVFGAAADSVVVANTKGFTGHPMGVGIEDVVAIKALETGIVPPVPNYKEVDPDLGTLNLSKGGSYPIRYALRLAAGFGSQIAMTLVRWTPTADGLHREPDQLGYAYRVIDRIAWTRWLTGISGRPDPELEVVKRTLRVHQETAAPAPRAPKTPDKPEISPVAVAKAVEPVPAVVVPVATAPVVVAPAGLDREVIRQAVLDLVAEKTGYPQDMLDPELDMEADLGVDTVKQAEIFAVIRETYDIHRDESLKLRDFPTINHVIGFVMDRAKAPAGAPSGNGSAAPVVEPAPPAETTPEPAKAAAPAAAAAVTAGAPAGLDREVIRQAVLDLVAEKTGYPQDMLDPELDMEADLGVDTVKQAEIFAVIRETYDIHRDESLKLRDFPTINHVIGFVMDRAKAPAGAPSGNGSAAPVVEPAPPAETTPEPAKAAAPAAAAAVTAGAPRRAGPRGDPPGGARPGGREDRVPAGHARPRAGHGGGPGGRHGEAGGDLRGDPRDLRHPPR